jgi:lysozyme family protein
MSKALTAIAAALALASLGSLVSGSAHAMGATSAPSRYNGAASAAAHGQPTRYNQANFPITEFSSSSAKTSAPKR